MIDGHPAVSHEEGPNGHETMADLFAGRSQLVVYHYMLGPDWHEGRKRLLLLGG